MSRLVVREGRGELTTPHLPPKRGDAARGARARNAPQLRSMTFAPPCVQNMSRGKVYTFLCATIW
jgi:hypothetical protein